MNDIVSDSYSLPGIEIYNADFEDVAARLLSLIGVTGQ